MIPLETNQVILVWLYAFPPDELASRRKKIAYFLFALAIMAANFSNLTAGLLFTFKFISIDIEKAVFALFHTIPALNMLYQCVVIVLMRRKLIAIFTSLTKIYNESKSK